MFSFVIISILVFSFFLTGLSFFFFLIKKEEEKVACYYVDIREYMDYMYTVECENCAVKSIIFSEKDLMKNNLNCPNCGKIKDIKYINYINHRNYKEK